MFMGPRHWFQGMNSASLCSMAGRYENPIPPRCLAPIDFLKIPAQNDLPKFTNTQREGEILKKYIRKASQTSLFAEGFRRQLTYFTDHCYIYRTSVYRTLGFNQFFWLTKNKTQSTYLLTPNAKTDFLWGSVKKKIDRRFGQNISTAYLATRWAPSFT